MMNVSGQIGNESHTVSPHSFEIHAEIHAFSQKCIHLRHVYRAKTLKT